MSGRAIVISMSAPFDDQGPTFDQLAEVFNLAERDGRLVETVVASQISRNFLLGRVRQLGSDYREQLRDLPTSATVTFNGVNWEVNPSLPMGIALMFYRGVPRPRTSEEFTRENVALFDWVGAMRPDAEGVLRI